MKKLGGIFSLNLPSGIALYLAASCKGIADLPMPVLAQNARKSQETFRWAAHRLGFIAQYAQLG